MAAGLVGAEGLGEGRCGPTIRRTGWGFRTRMDLFRRAIGEGISGGGLILGDLGLRVQGGRVRMGGIGLGLVDRPGERIDRVLRRTAGGRARAIGARLRSIGRRSGRVRSAPISGIFRGRKGFLRRARHHTFQPHALHPSTSQPRISRHRILRRRIFLHRMDHLIRGVDIRAGDIPAAGIRGRVLTSTKGASGDRGRAMRYLFLASWRRGGACDERVR